MERASSVTRSSIWNKLNGMLDVRSGLVGASLLGAIVWMINIGHGALGASTAALKQFVYTFMMGGLIMRLCTRLALSRRREATALALAIFIPSLVTVSATFLVHSLRGTPEPLHSTVPAAILSPLGFGVWSRQVRRDGRSPWDRPKSSESEPVDRPS